MTRASLNKFPSNNVKYLVNVTLDSDLSQYEIGWILREASVTLKEVSLWIRPDGLVLKELSKCGNIERMTIKVEGGRNEWQRVIEDMKNGGNEIFWNRTKILEITLSCQDMGWDLFAPSFRNLNKLILNGGSLVSDIIPKNLLQNLDDLRLLEELVIKGELANVDLPLKPNLRVRHLSLTFRADARIETLYSLDTWTNLFPRLRRLELIFKSPDSPLRLGYVKPENVAQLQCLKLEVANVGPWLCEVLNYFRNLTHLYLHYGDKPTRDYAGVPLGDFSKIKRLLVVDICGNDSSRLWLRQSILKSCLLTNRRDFVLDYFQRNPSPSDEVDIGRCLSVISEVSMAISVSVNVSRTFKPEWLELLSNNLKTLRLQFSSSGAPLPNVPAWRTVLALLQSRGVEIEKCNHL